MRDTIIKYTGIAFDDIYGAFCRYRLFLLLGFQDVRQRYQRSFLGPFWITLSMGVMISCIGVIFGTLFRSNNSEFLPFLAAGLILWTFILSCVTEGCSTFVSDSRMIQQISLPLGVYLFKVIWRNLIILGHNLLIIPLVIVMFGIPVHLNFLYFFPGLLLLTLNLIWVIMILSIICTRFRDMHQIVVSIMQVLFYLSPIIWSPSLLRETGRTVFLDINPIYYLLDIVRSPLVNESVEITSWTICGLIAIVGFSVAIPFYGKYKKRVPYWL